MTLPRMSKFPSAHQQQQKKIKLRTEKQFKLVPSQTHRVVGGQARVIIALGINPTLQNALMSL